ncbi:ubiquitin carboxyl-terminal hydrolase 20 isoform X2 [Neltuma alba]|uniref:ubiquitin carboxyl-terminal hydrolase 20 isoform X2 n=1 Tax=Neltuma alba TaxID=207710 RepID=UPI0010A2BCA8|nr:ubiquitin carboxyl-terminal hydrolase 20-like isoform X2 [Prosopis alba]
MYVHPPEILQARFSDSVLGGVPFNGALTISEMPASEAALTGSSPSSHSRSLDGLSLVPYVPNQMGVSASSSSEAQTERINASLPSNVGASHPYLGSKTLDDCSTSASIEISAPLVPQSSTLDKSSLPMATAHENSYYLPFCDSGGEDRGDVPEPIRSVNNLSYYPPLSSSQQWPSWPASSQLPPKETWNSELTSDEILVPSEDTGTPLNNGFNVSGIVPFTVGAGLENLGNTCFFNVILQCLTHTVPLIRGLCTCSHTAPCESGMGGFCVLCVLRDHIELSLKSSGRILSPLKLVDNLNYFSSFFTRYQQEDAHEFLQCFLDKLERCFLDLKRNSKSWEQVDNLVEKIFGGRLISKLQCCNCGHCSDTYEPLIDLSLEIENVDSLPSALASFTKVEKIDAKFICDSCKEEVSMEKRLILDQTPSVATFHLKRFKTDGIYVEKIDNHVDFPLELDLLPYTNCNKSNNEALRYDLYAIVVHVGLSSTSGHYFCFVRTAPDLWYRLDDSKVTRVAGDFVLSQEAYILLYARQGTPWLSAIMDASSPCFAPSVLNTSPKSVLDNVDGSYCPNPSEANFASGGANESQGVSQQMPVYSSGGFNEMLNDYMDSYLEAGQVHFELNPSTVSSNGYKEETGDVQVPCNEGNGSMSSHDEKGHQEAVDIRENDGFRPLTPPSSPGPDSNSPDVTCRIPRDHLKTENHERGKRLLNKNVDDSERKEAMRYLSKNVHGSRRSKLLGAMAGGPSHESYSIKKRKKLGLQCKKSITPGDRKKSNHGSVMCASR